MLIPQLGCKECLDMLDLRKEDLKRIGREPGLFQALSLQTIFFRLRQTQSAGAAEEAADGERRSTCSDDEPARRRSVRFRRSA
jgi:hypothetical protein